MNDILIALAVIAVVLILYIMISYNRFVHLKTAVDEAFATMDVYLKKRWDLIPSLIETVKGYAAHEKTVLNDLTELRSKSYSQMSGGEKMEVNQRFSSVISNFIAVSEAYPDLKASKMFSDFSSQLSQIETDIANARKYYNGVVKEWNIRVRSVPSNIVAGIFRYKPMKMYEIDSSERENVGVKFE